MTIFFERDLMRSRGPWDIAQFFSGPELSGNGHLPGSFYYVLLRFIDFLGFDWRGSYYLCLAATSFIIALLWQYLRKNMGNIPSLLFLFLILSSSAIYAAIECPLNSSWTIFFAALALLIYLKKASHPSISTPFSWYLGVFALGFGLHFHFTLSVLIVPLLIFPFINKLNIKQTVLSIISFLLPSIPYFIQRLANQTMSAPAEESALGYILRIAYQLGVKGTAPIYEQYFGISNAGIFLNLFAHLFVLITIITFIKKKSHGKTDSSFNVLLSLWTFALIPALIPIVAGMYLRYGGVLCVVNSVFCAWSLSWWMKTYRFKFFLKPVAIAFVILNLIFFLSIEPSAINWSFISLIGFLLFFLGIIQSFTRSNRFLFQVFMAIQLTLFAHFAGTTGERATLAVKNFAINSIDLEKIYTNIYRTTGWSTDEARKRLYFVNLFYELGFLELYRTVSHQSMISVSNTTKPDGFFIYRKETPDSDLVNSKNLNPSLAEGIRSGSIVISSVGTFGNAFELISYRVKDLSKHPPYFQNIGDPYGSKEIEFIRTLKKSTADSKTLAYGIFNPCVSNVNFCSVAISASSPDLTNHKNKIHVQIASQLLAQPSPSVYAHHLLRIHYPYIEFLCPEGQKKIRLSESQGNNPQSIFNGLDMLTPFERIITSPCLSSPVRGLVFGFESLYTFSSFAHSDGPYRIEKLF